MSTVTLRLCPLTHCVTSSSCSQPRASRYALAPHPFRHVTVYLDAPLIKTAHITLQCTKNTQQGNKRCTSLSLQYAVRFLETRHVWLRAAPWAWRSRSIFLRFWPPSGVTLASRQFFFEIYPPPPCHAWRNLWTAPNTSRPCCFTFFGDFVSFDEKVCLSHSRSRTVVVWWQQNVHFSDWFADVACRWPLLLQDQQCKLLAILLFHVPWWLCVDTPRWTRV